MSRPDKFKVPTNSDASPASTPDDFDIQINLRLRLDEVASLEAAELRRKLRKAPTRRQLCQLACQLYDGRRARARLLDGKLFGEPAWDMLLSLYCWPARGEPLTVTSLNHAADVPQTTGLRWQAILISKGLIERGPSLDGDGRRVLVRLTTNGRNLLEQYLTRLYFCDTPVPEHPDAHDD